jgi:HD-GYP domain-containing protein (c-di-GMP phosphodiesterase class II)
MPSSTKQPITADLIDLGQPLPVDVYDSRDRLLLRRGAVVSSPAQFERLLQDGLYGDAAQVAALLERRAPMALPKAALPSYAASRIRVTAVLADVKRALQTLLATPPATGFAQRLAPLVATLQRAVVLDVDAALGQIALDRSATPAVRHLVNCGVMVAALLLRRAAPAAEVDATIAAALTMNLTSTALQDVLYGQAGAPDAVQQAVIQAHPAAAHERLRALGVDDATWLSAVEQHHELFDGSGYPAQRAGEAICPGARLLALADQVCALLAERAYREPVNAVSIMRKLREAPPRTLDPALCAALAELMTPFPPGATVRLVTDDYAVVSRRTRQAMAPTVMVFVTRMRQRLEQPRKKLTGNELTAIAEPIAFNQIKPSPRPDEVWDEVVEPADHRLP